MADIAHSLSPALCESIKRDPALAAYNYFGLHCWSKQQQILESVFIHRKTLAHTGHAIGKTMIVPAIIALWLLSHPYSYVIVSAASWTQVKSKLFPALHNLVKHQKQPIFDTLPQAVSWKIDEEWQAVGLSPDQAEPIQGYHSKGKPGYTHLAGTLVLVDEASGIQFDIFNALMGLLTGDEDHILLLGNPIHADGIFAEIIEKWTGKDATKNPVAWNVIHVSSLESPNIATGRNLVPGLASKVWLEDMRAIYHEGTAEWSARVLGLVPDQTDQTFIPGSVIRACAEREGKLSTQDGPLRMTVDVAFSAQGDESVILVGGTTTLHHCWSQRGITEPELRARVLEKAVEYGGFLREIWVDYTGVGAPLVHNLRECDITGSPRIVAFIAAGQPNEKKRYANCRAEAWGEMRWGLEDYCIPREWVKKFYECAKLRSKPHSQTGRLLMEGKKEYKQRIGSSPDHGDALAMLWAMEEGESAFAVSGVSETLTPRYQLQCQPHIISMEKTIITASGEVETVKWFNLHLEGYPHEYDRLGTLLRACFYTRRGNSGCVWIHIDVEGAWTAYRTLRNEFSPIHDFWGNVQKLSEEEQYTMDIFSTPETNSPADYQMYNDLIMIERNQNLIRPMPQYISAGRIKGLAGTETINAMLLSTLARFPDDPYWHRDISKADAWLRPEMLVIWPHELVEEIEHARLREVREWRTDEAVDKPEDMVGGGGALVRALRLLVVCGGVYLGIRRNSEEVA